MLTVADGGDGTESSSISNKQGGHADLMCEYEFEQFKQEHLDLQHRVGELEAENRETNQLLEALVSAVWPGQSKHETVSKTTKFTR